MTRWDWAWAANTGFLWLGVFYGRLIDPDVLLPACYVWATWFVAQEALGTVLSISTGTSGRTWSEWQQTFADSDKGHSFVDTLTGWDAFVTANVILAAYAVGYVICVTWGQVLGMTVGALVALWLYAHFQNNRKHG